MAVRGLKLKTKKGGDARGVALVEALIVLGFLIFLLMALFDLFFMSVLYINLSQFAREGVLTGAGMDRYFKYQPATTTSCSMPQTDLQGDPMVYQDCQTTVPLDPTCGHYLVHWRVEKLFETLSPALVDPATSSVTTTCIADPSPGGTTSLQVDLQIKYRGYSPVFRNSMVRVRQMGLVRGTN